jgi:predicted nuclease of predicted toxin-antitoxin system
MPFQHDYADSTQVVLLGMESATDREGWQKARDEGFVIVTRDADYQLQSVPLPRCNMPLSYHIWSPA